MILGINQIINGNIKSDAIKRCFKKLDAYYYTDIIGYRMCGNWIDDYTHEDKHEVTLSRRRFGSQERCNILFEPNRAVLTTDDAEYEFELAFCDPYFIRADENGSLIGIMKYVDDFMKGVLSDGSRSGQSS